MSRPAATSWMRKRRRTSVSLYVIDCMTLRYSSWVPADAPPSVSMSGPPIVSEDAAAILGENGVKRIQEFWTYPSGWDFGKGNPLSPQSLALLEVFLAEFSEFQSTPSIFLSQDGHLVLAWEDAGGERIEVEFAPSGVELYFASNDAEMTFDVDEDIGQMMRALVEEIHRHDADAA